MRVTEKLLLKLNTNDSKQGILIGHLSIIHHIIQTAKYTSSFHRYHDSFQQVLR